MKKVFVLFLSILFLPGTFLKTSFSRSNTGEGNNRTSSVVTLATSVIVGGVTSGSARFRSSLTGAGSFAVEVSASPQFTNPFLSPAVSVDSAGNYAGITEVTGLQADTRYYYRAVINGTPADNKLRQFRTFPSQGSASTFNFSFGSCQQSGSLLPSGTPAGNIFKEVVKYNPRFFLQIGDWGYPDTTDNTPLDNNYFPKVYKNVQKSYAARFDTAYFMDSLFRMTPIDYVYDDHDFMNDNASAVTTSFSVPFKPNPLGTDFIAMEIANPAGARENSIRGYKENMPTYPLTNESRGIYHKFSYGNVEFFILDLRAQRSGNLYALRKNFALNKWEHIPDAGRTLLGSATSPGTGQTQLSWFLNALSTSTAKWKFIISSVPFNKAQAAAIQFGINLQDSILNVPPGLLPPGTTGIFAAHEFLDKWAGYSADQDSVLRFIRNNNLKNIIVLSGDSHTAAIDDGFNAGLPEIMAGGLDITNSKMASIFASFGLNIWNKGGQGISTTQFNNAFGNITVYGNDSVKLNLIDEFGTSFASYTVKEGSVVPVELISFTGEFAAGNAELRWSTATETNNEKFVIEKSQDNKKYIPIGSVKGAGTSTVANKYTFTDRNISAGSYYRLKQVDYSGEATYSHSVFVRFSVPEGFSLEQNYPNPFNPSTVIRYSLPVAVNVKMSVFDALGNEVVNKNLGLLQAGIHSFVFNASELGAGVYFYRISAGNYSAVKKLTLIK